MGWALGGGGGGGVVVGLDSIPLRFLMTQETLLHIAPLHLNVKMRTGDHDQARSWGFRRGVRIYLKR